jgi:hypothetical protein
MNKTATTTTPLPDLQRCNACGATIDEQETSCPECGRDDCLMYPIEPSPDPRPASRHMPDPRPVRWYDSKGSGGQGLICDERDGRTVAVAHDEKDAPLMAAAPRMRDALRGLLECPALNEDETEPETRAAVAEAWAAINEATQQ